MEELQLHYLITEQLFLIDNPQSIKPEEVPRNEIFASNLEPTPEKQETPVQQPVLNTATDSKAKIQKLLVITDPLTPETQEMLQKLLVAIGLKSGDYEISQNTALIKDYYRAIIFGKSGNKVHYTINQYEGMEAMRSVSLAELRNNVAEKRKLWMALQTWYTKSSF